MMHAQEFFGLIADLYKAKPDGYALSLGHWEADPLLGAPHQRFDARVKLTMGEVRAMAGRSAQDAPVVTAPTADGARADKALAVLVRLLDLASAGTPVALEEDWGQGSVTLRIGDHHTHCGLPDGAAGDLIDSLHALLVHGRGLGFAIPLAGPLGPYGESDAGA